MRIILQLILLILLTFNVKAQCPLNVQIVSTPDVMTNPVCKGSAIQLEANPSAGAVTPVYIWVVNGDTILGTDSILNINANSQNIEVYMATTTGCIQDTVSTTIFIQTVTIQPTVTILDSKCNPETADFQITSIGGTTPYFYDLVGIDTSSTGFYTDVPGGTYTLFITDSAGCNDTSLIMVVPDPPEVVTEAAPLITECNQTVADVVSTSTGGTSPYTYELVGVETNTSGLFVEVPEGTYTLYTTDSQGCADTNEVSVVPYTCPPPNPIEAFTPNDDGYSDAWFIRNIEDYPENEVFIYDRWGQRVYHKKGYSNSDGWKAKYIGIDMPVSTYYYILKYKSNNEEQVLNGAISIFR